MSESHVEKLKLKSFRFLTENELIKARMLAEVKEEDPEKVRVTADVEVWARPTELSNGHRIVEFTASSPQFVIHSRDLMQMLIGQDYDVIDLRQLAKHKT